MLATRKNLNQKKSVSLLVSLAFTIGLSENLIAEDINKDLVSIASSQPLPTSQSLGSIGYEIGVTNTSISPPSSQISSFFGTNETQLNLQRLYYTKGLPLPINVGLQFGADDKAKLTQAGFHISATVYERISMPSLSILFTSDTMNGYKDLNIKTHTLTTSIEYSPLHWVKLAVNQSFINGSIEYTDNPDSDSDWGLRDPTLDYKNQAKSTNSAFAYAITIKPMAGRFLHLTAERKESSSGISSTSFAISTGF